MASANQDTEANPFMTMAGQSQELPPAYTPDRLGPPSTTHTAPPPTPPHTTPRPTDSSASSIRDFAPNSPPPHSDAPLPPYTHSSTASRALLGGFRSEKAYLDALRSWASDKQYMEPLRDVKGREVSLTGFYGNMTSEDYIQREQVRRRGGAAEMREWKRNLGGVGAAGAAGSSRRGTAPAVLERGRGAGALGGEGNSIMGEEDDEISDDELYLEGSRGEKSDHGANVATQQRRRKGSLLGWIRRKRGDSVASAL